MRKPETLESQENHPRISNLQTLVIMAVALIFSQGGCGAEKGKPLYFSDCPEAPKMSAADIEENMQRIGQELDGSCELIKIEAIQALTEEALQCYKAECK
jgi:hypothetical protein